MSRQISIPDGAEPWLVNLIELKNRTDMSFKEIAEKKNLAEKSVTNVFYGKSKNPSVSLVNKIISALGGTLREIFAETDAVIATQDMVALQAEVDRLNGEVERLGSELALANAENAMLALANAENAVLKDKVGSLTAENDILRLKLEHKEEIIALHNFYIKQKSNG